MQKLLVHVPLFENGKTRNNERSFIYVLFFQIGKQGLHQRSRMAGESKMRYRYINKAYLKSGATHGTKCDPVKASGKCIVGNGSQLVAFEDGFRAIVIRRCLRLETKNEN
jgi:hypothetical protein